MLSTNLAVVFDFDDTLVPDSTEQLLRSTKKVDLADFWGVRYPQLAKAGWDQTLAYLKLLLDLTMPGQPLEGLTNTQLHDFGGNLTLYPGIPQFFDWVRDFVAEKFPYVQVKLWVISGGLEAIIQGCTAVSGKVNGVFGCRLASEDGQDGSPVKYIKRAISFTEKTRYLFHINKGQFPAEIDRNPGIVNAHMDDRDRPVPLSNMIYIGDGLTDIPCFRVVQREHGKCITIWHEDKPEDHKRRVCRDILLAGRTLGGYSPDYQSGTDLHNSFKAAISAMCYDLASDRRWSTD